MPEQSNTPSNLQNKPMAAGSPGTSGSQGIGSHGRGDRDALATQVDAVIAELKELGYVSKAAIKRRAQDARAHASDWAEAGKEKAMHYEEVLERQVREAPMKSLLIAAGVGALVGWLTSPRR